MTTVGASIVGARSISLSFLAASRESDQKIAAVVKHHGHLLRTRVMAKASGRPGPNVITGDYRRSITVVFSHAEGMHTATVGTNNPQARRLEFGFHGQDSLGRHYNQPPRPHFGPALDEIEPGYLAGLESALESLG